MASIIVALSVFFSLSSVGLAEEPPVTPHHEEQAVQACSDDGGIFDSIQFETSDLKSFEVFFGDLLRAPLIERRDHPDKDSMRGYCYRGVRLIIRRDYAVPRPTGWVQINFVVSDVSAVQREIESALKSSSVASLSEAERDRIVRIRLKPDVRRGSRKAARLEVAGPEGFMIGFNQYTHE
jgi:hypothetical protein